MATESPAAAVDRAATWFAARRGRMLALQATSEAASWCAGAVERLVADAPALALTMAEEVGKPVAQGVGEVQACEYRVQHFLKEVPRIAAPEQPVGNAPSGAHEIKYEPKGVVAGVIAWNFPVLMLVDLVVPALLAGNAVVVKPGDLAPRTALQVLAHFRAAGCPEDAFQVMVGDHQVGKALVGHDAVDSVVFIGSTATGNKVAREAHPLRTVVMELGGNDGFYVAPTCPLDKFAPVIGAGCFDMNGENCDAVERLYVHESVYNDTCSALAAYAAGLVIGDPSSEETGIGPLYSAEHVTRMEELVADAVSKGARVLCGGRRPDGLAGNFFAPTVLADCGPGMRVLEEETFGPVLAIVKVAAADASSPAAIATLLESRLGLTAGIFASDEESSRDFAAEVFARVDVGTVYFNKCGIVEPWMPWSGRRDSGRGTILGTHGIRECFLRSKACFW